MSRPALLLLVLTVAGCTGTGTVVHLEITRNTATAALTRIDLNLDLDGATDLTPLSESNGAEIVLPTTVNLKIRDGSGMLVIDARGFDASGTEVAHGLVTVAITRGNVQDASVALDDGGGPLIGTAQLAIDRAPAYDFAATIINNKTDAAFVISNPGTKATAVLATTIGGTNPTSFQITQDACTGQRLDPKASCTMTIRFGPTAAGSKAANFTVTADKLIATVAMTGKALEPGNLAIDPSTPVDFGKTTLGASNGMTQVFTVRNTGTAITGGPEVSLTGSDGANFTITDNQCAAALGAAASCTITVKFTPPGNGTGGMKTASLLVTAVPGGAQTATLNGVALTPAHLTLAPDPHNFMTADVGMMATQQFMLSNTGTEPSGLPSMMFATNTQYAIPAGTNTCTASVPGLGSCTFDVQFKPTTYGTKTDTLSAMATPGGTATASLTGVGRDYVFLRVTRTTENNNSNTATSGGSVAGGGINCGATCDPVSVARTSGDPTVTLTSTANANTQATVTGQWTGCTTPSGNTCMVTVNGSVGTPTTVNVSYLLLQFTVALTNTGTNGAAGVVKYDGNICGASCAPSYKYGDPAVLTAAANASVYPAPQNGFAGWTGGPCNATTTTPCTIASVTTAYNITATFNPYNYMFVSSQTFTSGNFDTYDPTGVGLSDGMDGFRGGDARCQALAAAKGLTTSPARNYMAWFARTADRPTTGNPAVNAHTRLKNGTQQARGWVLTNGRVFADDFAQFATYTFPNVDESAAVIATPFVAATGANGDGSPEPDNASKDNNCDGWTMDDGTKTQGGMSGDPRDGSQWYSRSGGVNCTTSSFRIYCFGTDFATSAKPGPPPAGAHRWFETAAGWSTDGGIAGADAFCKSQATLYGICPTLAGCTFKAYLATNGFSAASRFSGSSGEVWRYDGVRMATTFANLASSSWDAAGPDRRADGVGAGGYYVMGGAANPSANGTLATTCNDWMSMVATDKVTAGQAANIAGGTAWFSGVGAANCGSNLFYCLEP